MGPVSRLPGAAVSRPATATDPGARLPVPRRNGHPYTPPMGFDVPARAYEQYMGAWSRPLSSRFVQAAGVRRGQRVLDVGCGTGALTAALVDRLGAGSVAAIDPSESFIAAVRDRHPGVDVRLARAESLPFDDATFDASLAQLVVHFMADPVIAFREIARVTRTGGIVAACVWDFEGGHGPLGPFWDAARALDPDVEDESHLPGARRGHLVELLSAAGLDDVAESALEVNRSLRELRGLVGAVHAWCRAGRRVCRLPRTVEAGRAARPVPVDAAHRSVRALGASLGRPRDRVARPGPSWLGASAPSSGTCVLAQPCNVQIPSACQPPACQVARACCRRGSTPWR